MALRGKAKKAIKVGPVNTGSVAYPVDLNSTNEAAAYGPRLMSLAMMRKAFLSPLE